MQSEDMRNLDASGSMRTVSLLDLLYIAAKHRKLVVRTVSGCIIVAAVLLFLVIPRWYKSTAVVMAPKQKNPLGLIANLSRSTSPLRSLGLGAASDDLLEFQAILASRRVMESVVGAFDLMQVYDVDTLEKAVKLLEDNVEFGLGREDVSVEITVYDTDPQRAADMANFFVEQLNNVYLELSVSEAQANRQFLERRYQENIGALSAAEDSLKVFQQRYGVYSVPDQIKAAVEAAATIESAIALKEVEVGMLQKTTTADNPVRQAAELELRELRRKLTTMKYGGDGQQSLVFPPFVEAPEIGIEFLRVYREVEIQAKLLELLMPLYEQARIEEQRNTPSLLVLDEAAPAVKASKPKRLILMIVVGAVSSLLAFFAALVVERVQQSRVSMSEGERAKLQTIRREFHWRRLFR